MHKALKRQLKRYQIQADAPPQNCDLWVNFLEVVNLSYKDADQDRYLLERSLDLSSSEMAERWEKINSLYIQKNQSNKYLEVQNKIFSALTKNTSFNDFFEMLLSECCLALDSKTGYILKKTESGFETLFSKNLNEQDIQNTISKGITPDLEPGIIQAEGGIFCPMIGEDQSLYGVIYVRCSGDPLYDIQTNFVASLIPLGVIGWEKELALQKIENEHLKAVASSKKAALGDMAGGIAHEINNPLAIISMITQKVHILNSRGTLTQEKLELELDKISKTVDRVSRIIKALRAFSRDDTSIEKQPSNLTEILMDSMSLCSEKIKNFGVEIRNFVDMDKEVLVFCNPVQISQVIINLISNAFDAIEGLDAPWMEFSLRQEGSDIVLALKDAGPGIPEDIREKIMMPFFSTKEIGKGTGVGLSLCMSIMKDHGGALEYNSNCDNTEFLIKIAKYQSEEIPVPQAA